MIRLRSGCKINLSLRIGKRLANGYHELSTLYYPLPWPADDILLRPVAKKGIRIQCADAALAGPDNLLARAWDAVEAEWGDCPGLEAELIKRVPIGAGLGGGSANAAALLLWLNRKAGLSATKLAELALNLGADVPFFLSNRPCVGEGVGQKLTPIEFAGANLALVLVWPGIHIDTVAAFRAWDEEKRLTKRGHTSRKSNSAAPGYCWQNDLESPVFASYPELAEIKAFLLSAGAEYAAMSGSGSSVFGIFADRLAAFKAAQSLRERWPRVYEQKLRNFGM